MKLLIATAMLGVVAHAAPLRDQVFAGKPFAALLAETHRLCPQSPVRSASPAGLLDAEEQFGGQLDRQQEARVKWAIPRMPDGTPRACAGSPGGASCPANAGLVAIERAKLLPEFARMACALPGIWN